MLLLLLVVLDPSNLDSAVLELDICCMELEPNSEDEDDGEEEEEEEDDEEAVDELDDEEKELDELAGPDELDELDELDEDVILIKPGIATHRPVPLIPEEHFVPR